MGDIDPDRIRKRVLTSSFSLSSRASRSFASFSLIARSLSTHSIALFAAASGRDLFFSRSVIQSNKRIPRQHAIHPQHHTHPALQVNASTKHRSRPTSAI